MKPLSVNASLKEPIAENKTDFLIEQKEVDLQNIIILPDELLQTRKEKFCETVGDPYRFRVDNVVVCLEFGGHRSLEEALVSALEDQSKGGCL